MPANRTIMPETTGTSRASAGESIAAPASATPSAKATAPITVHTKKYPTPASVVSRARRPADAAIGAGDQNSLLRNVHDNVLFLWEVPSVVVMTKCLPVIYNY